VSISRCNNATGGFEASASAAAEAAAAAAFALICSNDLIPPLDDEVLLVLLGVSAESSSQVSVRSRHSWSNRPNLAVAVSAAAEGFASVGDMVDTVMGVVVVISFRLGEMKSSIIAPNSAGRFLDRCDCDDTDDDPAGHSLILTLPTATSFPQFSATSSSSSLSSYTNKKFDEFSTSAIILSGDRGAGERLLLSILSTDSRENGA
jgi:hypothetical protein